MDSNKAYKTIFKEISLGKLKYHYTLLEWQNNNNTNDTAW